MDWSGFFPGLVSTFVAVLAGALLSWWIAHWQLRREAKAQDHKNGRVAAELQGVVTLELRGNIASARQVADALGTAGVFGREGWRLASAMADPITDRAYRDLVASGLLGYIGGPKRREYYGFYKLLLGLKDRVRLGEAVLDLNVTKQPQVGTSEFLDGTRKMAASVLGVVDRSDGG